MTDLADPTTAPDFDTLRRKMELGGLTRSEAITIAGTYVLSLVNLRQRVFTYSKPLPEVAPGCQSTFTPRFQHQPWVDGEDVVQAGETPGGDIGFNRRFSNIEFDLRDLAQGLRDSYGCLAVLRAEVAALLGELRSEVNRINGDIHRLSGGDSGPVRPPLGGVVGGALAGIKFLGTGSVLGKDVQLWETQQGTMMIPLMTTVAGREVSTRVLRVQELAGLLKTEAALLKLLEAGPTTKEQLVRELGDVRTESGTLRELLAILPDKQQIVGADGLLEIVAEREALALRTGPGKELALAAAFGVDEKIESVATVPVEKFTSVPAEARIALMAAGIDTMEKLAAANDRVLAAALKRGGVNATAAQSAGWRAAAKTLMHLG